MRQGLMKTATDDNGILSQIATDVNRPGERTSQGEALAVG